MLSAHDESSVVFDALQAGAAGYLLKEASRDEIVAAVFAVARGESVLPSDVAAGLVGEIRLRSPSDTPVLTEREREILRLIADGKSLRRDRRDPVHRRHDREDACPARLRQAGRLRPCGRGRRGDPQASDRVAVRAVSEEDLLAAGERRVAWLRIAAVGLIAAAERLPHPNPNEPTFEVAAVIVLCLRARRARARLPRPARPQARARRDGDRRALDQRPRLSLRRPVLRRAARLLPDPDLRRLPLRLADHADGDRGRRPRLRPPGRDPSGAARRTTPSRFVAVQTGYLAWIGVASALFSGLLAARTQRLIQLARGRKQLLADVMTAEERERRDLAEALHDHAIQNLLAARQDIEDALKTRPERGARARPLERWPRASPISAARSSSCIRTCSSRRAWSRR